MQLEQKRGLKSCLGRSRGGFSSQIHLLCDAIGLPVVFDITGGQASDYKGYNLLSEDITKNENTLFLADRGYDADYIRNDIAGKNMTSIIPGRQNRKIEIEYDKEIYKQRNLVERCFNVMKHARRIATRYDKTIHSFFAFIQIKAIKMHINHFVNTT